jgi:hypothetical protein
MSPPITFTEYLQLSADDQPPIDHVLKERTVARLIVKNSLNNRLHEHLMTSYSTTKDDCYPNTISDTLLLLSTFVKQSKDVPSEDAVVSYHESTPSADDDDNLSDPEDDDFECNDDTTDEEVVTDNDNKEVVDVHVTFSATVMAAVIA